MAVLPVELIDLREDQTLDLQLSIEEANRSQADIQFTILDRDYADALRLHLLRDTHVDKFLEALIRQKTQWRGFHPYMICVVDCALRSEEWSNLFSAAHGQDGIGIITTHSVEETIIPVGKMPAYFVFELATHVLGLLVSGKHFHKETRKCIYDFREDKIEILDSIKSATLCDACREWFQDHGRHLSSSQLASVLRILRRSSELLEHIPPIDAPKKPRVFIGSSASKGLDIARAIQSELQHDYFVDVWNQNTVFGLGTATIEALEEAVVTYDYGIFVFTPDDEIIHQDKETHVPRDNVIFELGLFIGKLSRFRAFAIRPRGTELQIPSDLKGMTVAEYDPGSPNLDAAVGPACRQIRTAIAADADK